MMITWAVTKIHQDRHADQRKVVNHPQLEKASKLQTGVVCPGEPRDCSREVRTHKHNVQTSAELVPTCLQKS